MVLSLVDLSLRSIMDGIKNGTIRHPHLLPPKLRERVLDTAIKQGLACHPNCMPILTSVQFLNGMKTISANACNDNDVEFLERLISSLSTKLPNGQTVGNAITKLNLKVYDWYGSNFKNEKTYSDIISKVYDLIGQCPNAITLDLHVSKYPFSSARGYRPLNETENIACNGVMENLINLSVVSNGERILDSERPIINFKQLKTLKLDNCSFNDSWPKLLEKIPVLENLHLIDIRANANGLDWILPFPLPHLKSLEVLGFLLVFKCNKAFVDNLMECPQLRQVHLKLDETSTDEESLVRLASMNDVDLKINVRLDVYGNDAAENASILDSSSHFKLVSIFHEKMESFELYVWQEWNEQFSTALEDVVNTCSNLTKFGIRQPHLRVNQPQKFGEMKLVNTALVRFFGNLERAQQLKRLRLTGNFDDTVLSAVFDSCVNLVRLEIRQCQHLRDQHLMDWVSRGGGWTLTDFVVEECKNVTSEGIIPIFAKSDCGLLRYIIDVGQDKNGRDWKKVLRNRCPNAVIDS